MSETNPPPVAPVEGHYARLRNGSVVGPMRKEYEDQDWFVADLCDGLEWQLNGDFMSGSCIYPHEYDIIATISPADMQAVASGELERLRAALNRIEGMDYINQISGNANFERAQIIARTALQGDAP